MSFLERIRVCNDYDLSGFIPFRVNSQTVGWIKASFAEHLAAESDVFSVSDTEASFVERLTTPEARSTALAEVATSWVNAGIIRKLRNEIYPVRDTWSGPDHFHLDRGLAPIFGVRAYGVHLNGYVEKPTGIHMWIGKRSSDRRIEPNKLDNMVAGGQPAELSLIENLVKECAEEANLLQALAEQSIPVSAITYCFENESGLKPDTLFCYDLRVPDTFTPNNQDGEIADFRLMAIEDALNLIRDGETFKFNVSLVILDFAIRHGVLSPDLEPDYEEILAGLRQNSGAITLG